MTRPSRRLTPSPARPIAALLPLPVRRVAGFWLLALTLWLASAIALFR